MIKHSALRLFVLLILCIWTSGSLPAYSQDSTPPRFEVVTQMGGPITDSISLPDGSLLVAEGTSLIRVSTNSGAPQITARADFEHGAILALASMPPYAVALSEQGLMVFRKEMEGISQPISFLAGGGQSMAVQGDLIAVASQQGGLRLLKLGNDGILVEQGRLALAAPGGAPAPALDVALSPDQQFAYVATGDAGVHIINIRESAAPFAVGALPGVTPAEAITISGSLLAVGSAGHILMVDPTLGVLGTYAPIRDIQRMVVQDGYAYAADAAEGLKVLWMAAPDRPVLVYGEIGHSASDVALVGTVLFVAGRGELRVMDISNRYRPLTLGRVALPGGAEGISLELDEQGAPQRAFVAMGDDGVAILDIRNFANPSLMTRIHLEGAAHDTHYANGALYVALDTQGMAILDASAFGGETLVAQMALPGRALDLAQRGSTLYVAAGTEGILALDIFYATRPTLIGTLPLEALSSSGPEREALSLTISGKRAYVTDGDGFTVVDISRPTRMGKFARIDMPAQYVGVDGIYLYAASGSQIATYDARATAEPVPMRVYSGLSQIAHLTAKDNWLFATSVDAGPDAVVVNVLSPDLPSETGSTGARGSTVRITPVGDDLWLSAGLAGLRRYTLSEGGALIPRGSYSPVAEATLLDTEGRHLVAGGSHSWSLFDSASLQAASPEIVEQNLIDLAVFGEASAVLTQSRLSLYDLGGSDGPIQTGTHSHLGGAAVDMDAQYIYVAGARGLSIYDREHLMPIAQVATSFPAVDLSKHNSLLYLALQNGGLSIIDLGEPTGGIVRQRSIPTRHPTKLIAHPDGSIYGLADELLVRFFTDDVDRFGIAEEGTAPIIAPAGFFAGDLFALFVPGEQVRFYNIAGLHDGITWKTAITLSGGEHPAEVVTAGDRLLFAAYGDGGAEWINRLAPDHRGRFDAAPTHALMVADGVLFTAGDSLKVWNITGDTPTEIASIPLSSPATHLDWSDGKVLVSTKAGLSIASWNSTSLEALGTLLIAETDQAAVISNRAYLALHQGGLAVVDISDPQKPVNLFTYISPTGQFAHDLLELDDAHLLVSWENGIDVLNVGIPTEGPHLIDTVRFGGVKALSLSLNAEAELGAIAQGDAGVLLLDLADPLDPKELAMVDTPGNARAAHMNNQTLMVADGKCGLRVFDLTDPHRVQAAGMWRGGYASNLVESGGVWLVGSGNRLYGLRYNPEGTASISAMPQIPDPPDGSNTTTLETVLRWKPAQDTCDPLTYDVYFGIDPEPPFVGQVSGAPLLDVGKLAPQRTYSWRVEIIDAEGNRSKGPVWHFTTAPGTFPDALPPAPAPFIDSMVKNPAIPVGMLSVFIVLGIIGALYWRTQHPHIEADVPEWYSTQEEEELLEDE